MEFAIIAPLFFMIAFATFTGALTFNQKNQLTHAAREGARWGAVLQIDENTGDQWTDQVIQTTRQRAFGDLGENIPGSQICVALVEGSPGSGVSNDDGDYFKTVAGDPASSVSMPADTDSNRCFDDGGADGGRRVQIRVWRDANINAVLFNMDISLQSQATSRQETQSAGT